MKKKKRNRVILAICSMFIACMSIFAFIPKEKEIVKADTSYNQFTFDSSDYYFPSYVYRFSGNNYYNVGTVFPKISLTIQTSSLNEIVTSIQTTYIYNLFGLGNTFEGFWENIANDYTPGEIVVLSKDNTYKFCALGAGKYYEDGLIYRMYFETYLLCNSNLFNGNIKSIQVGSYLYNPLTDFTSAPYYNYIKFIDINLNYITLVVPFKSGANLVNEITEPSYFAYRFRTYYVNLDTNLDSIYYTQGYDKGYNQGFSDGEDIGYDDGYIVGSGDGYWLGKNDALSSEQYSFDNLLSAVIDVPVRTFTSLFNFEILGVNLSGFFLGLLTCCIVITVIRLIL